MCEELLLSSGEAAVDHTYASSTDGPSFIKRKKIQDAGLMQPSPLLADIVRAMEAAVADGLEEWWGQSKMVKKIYQKVVDARIFNQLLTAHSSHTKTIMETTIPKFIKCCLGAELKKRNQAPSVRSSKLPQKRK